MVNRAAAASSGCLGRYVVDVERAASLAARFPAGREAERVQQAGGRPTPVIDRHYFRSIYFREPSGVLFEIATRSPGFTIDEPLEHLGEKLSIPPFLESRRPEIEATVKPLENPRVANPAR